MEIRYKGLFINLRFSAPAWVSECCRLMDLLIRVHGLQDLHDLGFGLLIRLSLDLVGLLASDCRKDDVGSLKEAFTIERLKQRITSTLNRVGVELILGISIPE